MAHSLLVFVARFVAAVKFVANGLLEVQIDPAHRQPKHPTGIRYGVRKDQSGSVSHIATWDQLRPPSPRLGSASSLPSTTNRANHMRWVPRPLSMDGKTRFSGGIGS